jgi:hypothetical protein
MAASPGVGGCVLKYCKYHASYRKLFKNRKNSTKLLDFGNTSSISKINPQNLRRRKKETKGFCIKVVSRLGIGNK